MAEKRAAEVTSALQAMNSFMLGYSGEKHRRARDEAERRRVKQFEDRTMIMQDQAKWVKDDRERQGRRRTETHSALARVIGQLGSMKKLDKDPQSMRATVFMDLADIVRDNPDVDIGTVANFATGAADYLYPKKDVKTSVIEAISKKDGLLHHFLINMETGKRIKDLGASEAGAKGVSGTSLTPGDFNKWYSDMWGQYLGEYDQALENMISSGKFLHGSVLLSDMSMDAQTRLQKQRESYAGMRKAVLDEVGYFRDYLARFSVGLVSAPKDFDAFLDAVAPKLPEKAMVTFEQNVDQINAIVNKEGWTPKTLQYLRNLIDETKSSLPKDGENAEAALRAVLEDRGEPKEPVEVWPNWPWPRGVNLPAGPDEVTGSEIFEPGGARQFMREGIPSAPGAEPRGPTMYQDIQMELQDKFPDMFQQR